MITVTRFDGSHLVINADLVEFLEATPDTIVTLTTGKKVVILEPLDVVINAIIAYKHSVIVGPQILQED